MGIHRNSRYTLTKAINYVDRKKGVVPIFTRRPLLNLKVGDVVISHQVKPGETLDYLAFNYLNDASLWWVILDANPQYMTPWEVEPGDVLKIPSLATFRRAIRGV